MRLIIKLGYINFLFGKGANITELISAFDSVHQVTEKGYGNEQQFIVSEEVHPELILIPDDSVSLPENRSEFLDRYHLKSTECDNLRIETLALKKQIEDIKKAAETLK